MNIYTPTARFDTGRALTEDQLRASVPSIFADTAHASRSDRFRAIPTIDVLRALTREGFVPVGAKQSSARDSDKRDFTKHLIRLRRMDNVEKYRVGDTVCEILLKNANDGTSAYDLMAGLFRIQCLNSLVAQTGTLDSVKVRHSGDVQSKVIEGTYRVLEAAVGALEAPVAWSQLQLSNDERLAYAEAAHTLRFADAEGLVKTPIRADQLLQVRRSADTARDLWSTFNVTQENVLKGGLHGIDRTPGRPVRRMTTRAVKGIDQDVKLNRALWTLTQKMAELKGVQLAA